MSWWRAAQVANILFRDPQRTVSLTEWEDVIRRWGPVCAYKGIVPHYCEGGLQRGHQQAWSRFGRSTSMNCQPECAWINQFKGPMSNRKFLKLYASPFRRQLYNLRWFMAEVIRRNPRY
jgi:hypothetical protein